MLLNVLAHELQAASHGYELDVDSIFKAVAGPSPLSRRLRGRRPDCRLRPAGLPRPLRHPAPGLWQERDRRRARVSRLPSLSPWIRWDSVMVRDIEPGEAVFIDLNHNLHSR